MIVNDVGFLLRHATRPLSDELPVLYASLHPPVIEQGRVLIDVQMVPADDQSSGLAVDVLKARGIVDGRYAEETVVGSDRPIQEHQVLLGVLGRFLARSRPESEQNTTAGDSELLVVGERAADELMGQYLGDQVAAAMTDREQNVNRKALGSSPNQRVFMLRSDVASGRLDSVETVVITPALDSDDFGTCFVEYFFKDGAGSDWAAYELLPGGKLVARQAPGARKIDFYRDVCRIAAVISNGEAQADN